MAVLATLLAAVALASWGPWSTLAAPAPPSSTTTPAPAPPPPAPTEITPLQAGEDFYDQRQNGSENYRIHMDGMVVVVAPPEALLSISGAGNANGQGGILEQQLLDIVQAQQQAGVEDNDVRPGKPGSKPPAASGGPNTATCVEGAPGCKKRRPSPAKSFGL